MTLIDEHTRECLALRVAQRINSFRLSTRLVQNSSQVKMNHFKVEEGLPRTGSFVNMIRRVVHVRRQLLVIARNV
jgi:hypothetical protein